MDCRNGKGKLTWANGDYYKVTKPIKWPQAETAVEDVISIMAISQK
tara:strand:+ start:855 stop:992 length:138 start_codon:yes stop_codon:yes gene_type:complete